MSNQETPMTNTTPGLTTPTAGYLPTKTSFTPDGPYIRVTGGQPLVVLTKPTKFALTIDSTGVLRVQTLCGITGNPFGPRTPPTPEQVDTASDIARKLLSFVAQWS